MPSYATAKLRYANLPMLSWSDGVILFITVSGLAKMAVVSLSRCARNLKSVKTMLFPLELGETVGGEGDILGEAVVRRHDPK